VPQAQDLMVPIGELVKTLNLYSNSGVAQNSNVNKTLMLEMLLKGFGCKRLNLIELFLTWSLCFIALFMMIILLCYFFFSLFLFLGFALHNTHVFHSRIDFVSSFHFFFKKKKRKMKEKGSKMCFAFFFL